MSITKRGYMKTLILAVLLSGCITNETCKEEVQTRFIHVKIINKEVTKTPYTTYEACRSKIETGGHLDYCKSEEMIIEVCK